MARKSKASFQKDRLFGPATAPIHLLHKWCEENGGVWGHSLPAAAQALGSLHPDILVASSQQNTWLTISPAKQTLIWQRTALNHTQAGRFHSQLNWFSCLRKAHLQLWVHTVANFIHLQRLQQWDVENNDRTTCTSNVPMTFSATSSSLGSRACRHQRVCCHASLLI